jgi:hypothetical protein
MRRRIFWIFFAFLAFAILTPVSISSYKDWQVYTKGVNVTVQIVSLPRSTPGLMKFKLNESIYDKKISSKDALNAGDSLQLKYLRGFEGHFLFPTENPIPWAVFSILLFISLGIACLYYAFKKDSPPVEAFGKKIA